MCFLVFKVILFLMLFTQAAMLFSSGVFWTGLLFIPVASLLLDVVYKV